MPYTILTLRYRKPGPAFQPYEDMKNRTNVARLLSAWFLSRVYEPAYQHARSDSFSLLEFMRRAPKAHFGRFVFYCLVMNIGLGFVGPFLGWYLLDQLGFTPAGFAPDVCSTHTRSLMPPAMRRA